MYWLIFMVMALTLSLLSMLMPYQSKTIPKILLVMAFLFFVDGYFNGIDWVNYYVGFNDNQDFLSFVFSFEPLFGTLLFILKSVTNDYYWSMVIFYLIILLFLYLNSSRLTASLGGNLTVLLGTVFFVNGIGFFNDQIRQLAAFIVCIAALRAILENKKKFYLLATLAVCFHYSAIIIMFLYPLIKKRKSVVILSGFVLSIAIIFLTVSHDIIFTILSYAGQPGAVISGKLRAYFDQFEIRFGALSLVDIAVVAWFISCKKFNSESERIIWNGAFIAAILHFLFYFMPIFQRFNPYFSIFYCILFSCYFKTIYTRLTSNAAVVFMVVILVSLSVNIGYFNDPARPDEYRSYFIDYATGNYNIDRDRIKRCNEFVTDVPFCRW